MKTQWLLLVWFLSVSVCTAQYRIGYFRDTTKQITIQEVKQQRFIVLKNRFINFGKDSANHWLRIYIKNEQLQPEKYYVEVDFPWFDEVLLTTEDGHFRQQLSWRTPLEARLVNHQHVIWPINLNAQQDTVVYLRLYKQLMLVTGEVNVRKEKEFIDHLAFNAGFFGGFGGLVLVIFLFSLLIFFINWDRLYLYYGLYLFFYLGFLLTLSGYFLPFYQRGFGFFVASEFKNYMLWASQLSLLLFVRKYVLEDYQLRKLNRIIWIGTLAFFCSIPFQKITWSYLLSTTGKVPDQLLLAITFSFFVPILTSFYFVLYSYFNNINRIAAQAYLIGIMPFFLVAFFSYLRNLGMVEHSWLLGQKTQMACVAFDILVLMVGLSIRYRQLREEKEKNARLALENQLKLLQEKERISRDLHDSVGSQLTIVSTGLENAMYLVHKQQLTADKLEGINGNVRTAVQSLRDTIWATYQPQISLGDLELRLKSYIHNSLPEAIDCRFAWERVEPSIELSSVQAIHLFRVFQEALQNILKHAKATHIEIVGVQQGSCLLFQVNDNGCGMENYNAVLATSYGLKNMQTRLEEIGGALTITSTIKQGTSLSFRLPISP